MERAKGNGLKLCQKRFRLDIRGNFLTKRVFGHLSRPPRAAGESPFLDRFRKDADVALGDMV